jgi:tetratricopeptide (TPR) repeat protein
MEVVIILIILGIIGYLIYQSLPNTKFEKAQNLFNAKDYVQAINILNEIFEKHADAPAKLAECKLNLGKQTSAKSDKLKFFNDVVEIRKRISNSLSIARFDNIEVKALFEIAKIQYEESKADIEKLNQNLKFIDNANKKGLETDFNTLRTKHFNQLSESYFIKAIGHEKSNKYPDAIQVYKKAIECSEKGSNNSVKHNSIARIEICNLKQMSLEYN